MQQNDKGKNGLDFPKAIVGAIEALADGHRRQILIHLKENDALAYSELLSYTSLEKGTLNHHLEKLMAGALIRNFRGESPASQYSSFYELSNIARRLIDNIFNSFTPPSQLEEPIDSASGLAPYDRLKDSDDYSIATETPTVSIMPLCAGSEYV